MSQLDEAKKMYSEIMDTLKKYKSKCVFNIDDLEYKSKAHIYGLELNEKYGLNIEPKQVKRLDYNKFGEWKIICWFGEKHNRKISWSVDGRQPEDELIFTFSFPTGPYIFSAGGTSSGDYPQKFFQKFWLELKTYNPDYVDEMNKCLYWKIENAKEMFNNFDGVLKKYYDLNRDDIKRRQIERMEQELNNLKKSQ